MSAVVDGITIVVLLFILALSSIFGFVVFDPLHDDIVEQNRSVAGVEVSTNLHNNYIPLMDNLFLFAFILFTIFVLISVFLLDTHPIFFMVSIFLLVGVFIAASLVANAFDDVARDPSVSPVANQFTYLGWIMGHLLELVISITFMVSIALFAKYKLT